MKYKLSKQSIEALVEFKQKLADADEGLKLTSALLSIKVFSNLFGGADPVSAYEIADEHWEHYAAATGNLSDVFRSALHTFCWKQALRQHKSDADREFWLEMAKPFVSKKKPAVHGPSASGKSSPLGELILEIGEDALQKLEPGSAPSLELKKNLEKLQEILKGSMGSAPKAPPQASAPKSAPDTKKSAGEQKKDLSPMELKEHSPKVTKTPPTDPTPQPTNPKEPDDDEVIIIPLFVSKPVNPNDPTSTPPPFPEPFPTEPPPKHLGEVVGDSFEIELVGEDSKIFKALVVKF